MKNCFRSVKCISVTRRAWCVNSPLLDEMPEQILLVPDNYTREVTAGDSVAASFTDSYFKGTKEFTISKGRLFRNQ